MNFFKYFCLFYSYTGIKILLLLLVILLSGFMDSIGIMLFVPIFNTAISGEAAQDSLSRSIVQIFQYVNLELTFMTVLSVTISVFLLKAVFTVIQAVIGNYITENVRKDLRLNTLRRYAQLDYSFIIARDIGFLTNVVMNEITKAVQALNTFITVLVAIIYAALYFGLAFFIDSMVTVGLIGICSLMYSVIHFANRYSRSLSIESSSVDGNLQKMVIQYIAAYKYLKSGAGFERLLRFIDKLAERTSKIFIRIKVTGAIVSSSIEPIAVVMVLVLIYYRTQVLGVSFAESMILIFFIYKVYRYVMTFQHSWHRFNSQIGGFLTLNDLSEKMRDNIEESGSHHHDFIKKDIRYKGVSLKLGDKTVLADISLDITKNSTVAFVGRSGAGKTTFVDVLLGLYKPTAGRVLVDGQDLRQIDIHSFRRRVGYVTQDPIIFNDSVFNNISMWDNNAGSSEDRVKNVRRVMKLANCDFIADSQEGMGTVLGDRGVNLSGGQRQRVAIARELYKEPEILIFDEATSALDAESERLIQQSINELHGKMTMIVIAHRLSSVRNCDTIYVLDKGKVVEHGPFNVLYENKGSEFYGLYKLQEG